MSTETEVEAAARAYFEAAPEGCVGYEAVSDRIKGRALPRFTAVLAAVEPLIRERMAQEVKVASNGLLEAASPHGSPPEGLVHYTNGMNFAAVIIRGDGA